MIDTPINDTLADLLEVYRVKVTNLEGDADSARSAARSAGYRVEDQKKRADSAEAEAERHRKTIQERAEVNTALMQKVKKLEGVIESLHIELQNEREARHTPQNPKADG